MTYHVYHHSVPVNATLRVDVTRCVGQNYACIFIHKRLSRTRKKIVALRRRLSAVHSKLSDPYNLLYSNHIAAYIKASNTGAQIAQIANRKSIWTLHEFLDKFPGHNAASTIVWTSVLLSHRRPAGPFLQLRTSGMHAMLLGYITTFKPIAWTEITKIYECRIFGVTNFVWNYDRTKHLPTSEM